MVSRSETRSTRTMGICGSTVFGLQPCDARLVCDQTLRASGDCARNGFWKSFADSAHFPLAPPQLGSTVHPPFRFSSYCSLRTLLYRRMRDLRSPTRMLHENSCSYEVSQRRHTVLALPSYCLLNVQLCQCSKVDGSHAFSPEYFQSRRRHPVQHETAHRPKNHESLYQSLSPR